MFILFGFLCYEYLNVYTISQNYIHCHLDYTLNFMNFLIGNFAGLMAIISLKYVLKRQHVL